MVASDISTTNTNAENAGIMSFFTTTFRKPEAAVAATPQDTDSVESEPVEKIGSIESDMENRDQDEPAASDEESRDQGSIKTTTVDDFSNKQRDDASTYTAKTHVDVNYDENPTKLFMLLQKKDWNAVLSRSKINPDEARIWVTRFEEDGHSLRWRLLPIHASIIFQAPEDVVQALLEAYPKGAQSKDDQGMLPLHLAFRHGSTVGLVNLLLVAYPQSVKVKDKRGRIPLTLVQASNSPNRDAFMQALQRGPTFYAVAAAATERAAVTAEQRAIFNAKLIEVEKKHKAETDTLKAEKAELEGEVSNLKSELDKSQAATQVLVKLVNSLEGQLANMSESESFLAKKIVALDSNLKKITDHKDKIEAALQSQIDKLVEDKLMLQAKAGHYQQNESTEADERQQQE